MDLDIVQLINRLADKLSKYERYTGTTVKKSYLWPNYKDIPVTVDITAEVQDQKLHGLCTISYWYYKDYKIECVFCNGLKHGRYYEVIGLNQSLECFYQDDVLHGRYRYIKNNICIVSRNYIYGRREGRYEENYDSGSSKIRSFYRDNMKQSTMTPWMELCSISRQGEYKEFYPDGRLKVYCSKYTDDKRDGIYAEYDERGELDMEALYQDDVVNGPRKIYYRELNLVLEETYENGILVKSEKYSCRELVDLFSRFLDSDDEEI